MTILVTGAAGFIGRRLVAALARSGTPVRALVRRQLSGADNPWPPTAVTQAVADLERPDTLKKVCDGVESVFHLAGYAHAEDANEASAASVHQRVAVAGTRALLSEAARAGVRCFVFVSSVKAMGEGGPRCLDESCAPAPVTAYGQAKLATERLVIGAGQDGRMRACVLRLPAVYGPGPKGNLVRMIAAIDRRRFPPLPDVGNNRSMVHVDDVVLALRLAAERPRAAGQTYLITDGEAYSARRTYNAICKALGRRPPRWSVPTPVLTLGALTGDAIARLSGKPSLLNSHVLQKLLGSAWYSSAKAQRELGFVAQHTLETALPGMVASYRAGGTHGA